MKETEDLLNLLIIAYRRIDVLNFQLANIESKIVEEIYSWAEGEAERKNVENFAIHNSGDVENESKTKD